MGQIRPRDVEYSARGSALRLLYLVAMSKPNFLYIGPDKAGSTWLFRLLKWHPQTYVTPSKDTLFFDEYYDRGIDWYEGKFSPHEHHEIVAEIGHNYLFSEKIPHRIQTDLGPVRLMVCLREPARRAYSAYLYLLKHDLYRGSFEEALEDVEELREHGRYVRHPRPYIQAFGTERIHIGIFDELKESPEKFARQIFRFLGVEKRRLPEALTQKSMPAAEARSKWIAHLTKRAAWLFREIGLSNVVGRIKTSPIVHRLLYSSYDEKPTADPRVMEQLRKEYAPTVEALDRALDLRFRERWGYYDVESK